MTRDSDRPIENHNPLRLLPAFDAEVEADENGWATATRRVLLYLKALGVPPRDSLYLAREALDCAEREQGSPPLQASLKSLRSLLCSRGVCPTGFPASWTTEAAPKHRTPMAVPPLRPGQMTPARIDRRPWLTFLVRCARRSLSFLKKGRTGRGARRHAELPRNGPGAFEVREERLGAP